MVEPKQREAFRRIIAEVEGARAGSGRSQSLTLRCDSVRQLRVALQGIVDGTLRVSAVQSLGLCEDVNVRVVHPALEVPFDLRGRVAHVSGADVAGRRQIAVSIAPVAPGLRHRARQILMGLELPVAA